MFDIKEEAVLKAASALTGGIGGKADVCGALAGGSMMLGVVLGMGREGESIEKMVPAMMQTGEYYDWFTKEFRSSRCYDIITRFGNGTFYDFGIPEQAKAGTEAGVLAKCDDLVQQSVVKIAGMILDAQEAAGMK
jgi:C_GCAxxG_C_C family probable redox protein